MKIKNLKKNTIMILISYIVMTMTVSYMFAPKAYAEDDDILKQVKETLVKNYIGEIPESVLNATTVEEVLMFLGDPYAQYFTKGEFNDFLNEIDMKFIGIGVNLEELEGVIKVVSVFPNSPAREAGIKTGDIVSEVNGQSTEGLTCGAAVVLINGEEGEMINLKIIRDGVELYFNLISRKIPYPTVSGHILNNNIGYIRISSLGSLTGDEFGDKLQELQERNIDSYIIDLRNNHGGYLYPVLDIAGYFIGNTTVFIAEDNAEGRHSLKGYDHGDIMRKPVIFLSNEFTASAAEVLLASIRNYNRGFIIGENTYGKGVAQGMFMLKDGSVLKTSTLKFFTPSGKEISNTGITPDLKINLFDPLYAAELLLGNSRNMENGDIYTRVKLQNNMFDINISKINDKNYWEAYRTILSKASYYSVLNNKHMLSAIKAGSKTIPQVGFLEIPKTQYQAGDRVSFKLSAPNYTGRVQYRAELWNDESNTYTNLWNSEDGYYIYWQPRGIDEFTIGFPISKPGNYRIKIYAKRAGLSDNKTMYKEMGCDCYMGEIPFMILPRG